MPISLIPHVDFLQSFDISNKISKLCKDFPNVKVAVAYVKKKGFDSLSNSMCLLSKDEFISANLRIKFIVGLSESHFTTDYEPLQKLLDFKEGLHNEAHKIELRYIPDSRFHAKMFVFNGDNKSAILVGSSNITQGGLKNNSEANLLLEADSWYPAIKNANSYFDWLWQHSLPLTSTVLMTYKEDKEQGPISVSKNKGRLPKSLLPKTKAGSDFVPKNQELTIWVDGNEYPLSQIAGQCNKCGKLLPIPDKWLQYFVCSEHAGNQIILRKKRGSEINLKASGAEMKDVSSIGSICRKRKKDGDVCGTFFNLEADFSHQICSRCYDNRKAENKPRYKIPPREDYANSFFYDASRSQIYAKRDA